MNNAEKESVRLPSGCIVDMSVDVYDNLYRFFTDSQDFTFNNFINAGVYFPQIIQFIWVLVIILQGHTEWHDIILCNVLGGAWFTLCWFWIKLYKLPFISFISCFIGGYLFRFFIPYVPIAIISFFILKDWKVFLFYVLGCLAAFLVRTILFSLLSTTKYNDEVVRYVSSFKFKQ